MSISPPSGWVDGCTDVTVSGAGFGTDASSPPTVRIDGKDIDNLTLPTQEINLGYQVLGRTPAGDAAGLADVYLRTTTREETLSGGFTYLACPSDFYPESVLPDTGLVAGASVEVRGCNLGGATKVQLVDGAGVYVGDAVSLAPTCSTAIASFDLPASLADGAYTLAFLDDSANVVYPAPCDAADTATPCDTVFTLTVGGAE